ncbi:MAG TPA: YlbF family regulator [Phycisphaerae bacterium]|nr:YlbF family regulator [Phycisphaerae bacterium]
MDEIVRRAEDLGRAIREHPRYKRLLETDAGIRADKAATEALDAYNKAAVETAKKEEALKPVEPEEKRELERLMQAVAANETVKAFMKAQTDYAELMKKMNDAIYGQLAPLKSEAGPDQAQK